MKKWIVSVSVSAVVIVSGVAPVFADVLRSPGQATGHPYASESNTGSIQGQTNRSSTGTTNKFTHDGIHTIWD
jgi:hypothetical protein